MRNRVNNSAIVAAARQAWFQGQQDIDENDLRSKLRKLDDEERRVYEDFSASLSRRLAPIRVERAKLKQALGEPDHA